MTDTATAPPPDMTDPEGIESPLSKLSRRADRRTRQGVRRDPRRGVQRPRRARREVHPLDDRDAPAAGAAGPGAAGRLPLQARVARRDDRPFAGQDPREHGDRPQRHARPVGLDEQPRDPLIDLGLGHGLDRRRRGSTLTTTSTTRTRTCAARTRTSATRSCASTRPRSGIPVYLAQPFYNVLLMALFEWGVAFHDMDLEAHPPRREVAQGGARGPEGDRRQGQGPGRQGLRRLPGALGHDRGRRRCRSRGAEEAQGAPQRRCRRRWGQRQARAAQAARRPESQAQGEGRSRRRSRDRARRRLRRGVRAHLPGDRSGPT